MKLRDLDPGWVSEGEGRHGMGLTFDCPHCRETKICVWFRNPIDGLPPSSDVHLWTRTGETFDDLTLDPSIDARISGHWHGYIRNGETFEC